LKASRPKNSGVAGSSTSAATRRASVRPRVARDVPAGGEQHLGLLAHTAQRGPRGDHVVPLGGQLDGEPVGSGRRLVRLGQITS
jgi:hypothetical protein